MSHKGNGVPRCSLYLRTMELLRNRPVTKTLKLISEETGIPEGWLASILSNPEMVPGVDRVQLLYEYLSQSKLKL